MNVTFYSPGTMVSEENQVNIEGNTLQAVLINAVKHSKTITQRHNAIPYGFRVQGSMTMYYLPHCKVIPIRNIEVCEKNSTLLYNITQMDVGAIVQTTSGWSWTQPFGNSSYLLDNLGNIIDSGNNYPFHKDEKKNIFEIACKYSYLPNSENRIKLVDMINKVYC